jgi:hypothetical protein
MNDTFPPDSDDRQRVVFMRLMVEKLQDHLLEEIEHFAENHPDCDAAAFPVADGQAFVAQCLKAYGEYGFEEARKHAALIIDGAEDSYRNR